MIAELIGFAAIGRLVIWVLQNAEPLDMIWPRHWFFQNLRSCDLCLGIWVYSALGWFTLYQATSLFELPRGVNAFVIGMIFSTLVHLLILGWKVKYALRGPQGRQ